MVQKTTTLVVYESTFGIFTNIFHSRGGYDLGFDIGEVDHRRNRLSKYELYLLAGVAPPELMRPNSYEAMQVAVPKLAAEMRLVGLDALAGRPEPFADVWPRRNEYTRRMGERP